mmetsp:Transcript_65473/g.161241  ORF Transcript_65473/g.161241 Transcript_65473/m.161241 type:complete len:152 (-) Transcript_65473:384-839(-)
MFVSGLPRPMQTHLESHPGALRDFVIEDAVHAIEVLEWPGAKPRDLTKHPFTLRPAHSAGSALAAVPSSSGVPPPSYTQTGALQYRDPPTHNGFAALAHEMAQAREYGWIEGDVPEDLNVTYAQGWRLGPRGPVFSFREVGAMIQLLRNQA